MKRAGPSAAILALGLSACVQYAPAPPHPEAFVGAFDSRQFVRTSPGPWTSGELLASAIERNPQIVEARAKYEVALAAARAAKTPPGSALTLTAEYANEVPHWGYTAAADIALDYGARRSVRITTANLQALQAFYDYGEAIWSVRTDLERARIDVLAAREELRLAREAYEARKARADRLDQRVLAGQDARALAIVAQAEARTANERTAASRGRLNIAMAALAKALGVGSTLPQAPMVEVSVGASLENLGQWRRDAALSRRDVLRAIADYDIAENALRLEVANQYPQVGVGPAYNYDHGVTKLPFSLSLALPPVDLNRHAIVQAEAARAAAGRSLELTMANALAAVDTAAAALGAAVQAVDAAQGDLNLALQSETHVKLAVDAGKSDRVDEMAARAARLDAALSLGDAQHAAALAKVDLEDALRRAFDPAETTVIQAAMTKVRSVK